MVEYEITCRECDVTVTAPDLYKHLRDEHGLTFIVEQVSGQDRLTQLQAVEDLERRARHLPLRGRVWYLPQVMLLRRRVGKLRDREIERMLR